METIPLKPERKAQLEEYAQRRGQDPATALDDVLAGYLEWKCQDFEEASEGIREGYEDVKACSNEARCRVSFRSAALGRTNAIVYGRFKNFWQACFARPDGVQRQHAGPCPQRSLCRHRPTSRPSRHVISSRAGEQILGELKWRFPA